MNAYSMTKQCLKDMKRSLCLEWLNAAKERRNKNVAQVYIFISPCVCVCVYRKKAMNLSSG